jgi:hypothetical protein
MGGLAIMPIASSKFRLLKDSIKFKLIIFVERILTAKTCNN